MFPFLRDRLRHAQLLGLLSLLPCAACRLPRSPSVPMAELVDRGPATPGPRALLVLLPGTGDSMNDLVRHGLIRMIRERRIAADVVIADAHYGYYRTRQTVQRLWTDVIAPRAADYDELWLAGVSIGGLGAILCASDAELVPHPPVTGVLAIAPWLADGKLIAEIESAGGLRSWVPRGDESDSMRRLLAWLRGYADMPQSRPQLFVGVGHDDRLIRHARLILPLLPPANAIEVPGTHDWEPWLVIWGTMLDRAPLPRLPADR